MRASAAVDAAEGQSDDDEHQTNLSSGSQMSAPVDKAQQDAAQLSRRRSANVATDTLPADSGSGDDTDSTTAHSLETAPRRNRARVGTQCSSVDDVGLLHLSPDSPPNQRQLDATVFGPAAASDIPTVFPRDP